MSLLRVGFQPSDVFEALTWSDGRIGIRAEVEGREATFQFCIHLNTEFVLQGSYVNHHGLKILRPSRHLDWGACQVGNITALGGRFHTSGEVPINGGPFPDYGKTYAGMFGTWGFRDLIIGLDAAGPAIGISGRNEIRDAFATAISRFPFTVEGESTAVTTAIKDDRAISVNAPFRLSMSEPSAVYLSHVGQQWSDRSLKRKVERAYEKGHTIRDTIAAAWRHDRRTGHARAG